MSCDGLAMFEGGRSILRIGPWTKFDIKFGQQGYANGLHEEAAVESGILAIVMLTARICARISLFRHADNIQAIRVSRIVRMVHTDCVHC